jgi:DHA1 family bicyclomycin/chloramphenicol resistance-like MFS transporter
MRLKVDSIAMTTALGAMTAIGPISTDMYLPSLPDINVALDASVSHAQLTLSAFLIGFALGQIVYGPLSDKYGRKPVLAVGFALYVLGALGCALARTIDWLIVARIAQAFGGAASVVIARAIVRDLYEGARAARELSLMGAIMALTPTIAPTFGGLLQVAWGWRANFIVCTLVVSAFAIFLAAKLPETIRQRRAEAISPSAIFGGFRLIASHAVFRIHVGLIALTFAGLFSFISASSFVLQGAYHLSPLAFGWAFGACAGASAVSMLSAARLVTRLGVDRVIRLGAVLSALGGGAQILGALIFPDAALALVTPMMLYMLGLGLTLPQAMARALTPFPERAGAASSLAGFVQMSSGAIVGALVGVAIEFTPLALPLALCAAGFAALALHLYAGRRLLASAG